MTYSPRFCKLCPHLDPKESKQDKYQKHWCHRYNRQVYHLRWHPEIVRVSECDMPEGQDIWICDDCYRAVGKDIECFTDYNYISILCEDCKKSIATHHVCNIADLNEDVD